MGKDRKIRDVNEMIFLLIEEKLKVHKNSILSQRRTKKTRFARDAFAYISREVTKDTFAFISGELGRKGHESSMYMHKRMHDFLLKKDKSKEESKNEVTVLVIIKEIQKAVENETIYKGRVDDSIIYRWKQSRDVAKRARKKRENL